jgi:signal transduction histidine kinase
MLLFSGVVFSQHSAETIKMAIVYKIMEHVTWKTDTISTFYFGLYTDNAKLVESARILAEKARVNGKKVTLRVFPTLGSIQDVHLLYVDNTNNLQLSSVFKKIGKQNTLIVTEEHTQPGEIMINLVLSKTGEQYSFEYNRANILFQGLELSEKIVFLKGTEIEVRELYLQAKKLWDEQKAVVEDLKQQAEIQNQHLNQIKDSLAAMSTFMEENKQIIEEQNRLINQKDSISGLLNNEIKSRQEKIEIIQNQINVFQEERAQWEMLIGEFKHTVGEQKILSDSLANDIMLKTNELNERKKELSKQEVVIQRQLRMLISSFLIIAIVLLSAFLVYRAYWLNKKAKQKIAEQKEELEATLENLKSTQQKLVQSEKMASLGVLVAGIAHEINNPVNFVFAGANSLSNDFQDINSVISVFDAINDKPLTPEEKLSVINLALREYNYAEAKAAVEQTVQDILVGAERIAEIVDGLRKFSRGESQEWKQFDIHQAIDGVLVLLKNQYKNRIEIVKNFDSQLPLILSKGGQLIQVFMNILTNSCDAIEGKGTITITTKLEDEKIYLSFADTGKGIPDEIKSKIFDPFFTTKDVGKGTGLGLSISYGIVDEHHGTIEVISEVGHGTTFTLHLPVNQKF